MPTLLPILAQPAERLGHRFLRRMCAYEVLPSEVCQVSAEPCFSPSAEPFSAAPIPRASVDGRTSGNVDDEEPASDHFVSVCRRSAALKGRDGCAFHSSAACALGGVAATLACMLYYMYPSRRMLPYHPGRITGSVDELGLLTAVRPTVFVHPRIRETASVPSEIVFQRIPEGAACSEFGWDNIVSADVCEAAATSIPEATLLANRVVATRSAEWPIGCFYVGRGGAERGAIVLMNVPPGDGTGVTALQRDLATVKVGAIHRQAVCTMAVPAFTTSALPSETSTTTMVSAMATMNGTTTVAMTTTRTASSVAAPRNESNAAEQLPNDVVCHYLGGVPGDSACLAGTVPLAESECRAMPYHFGGRLRVPFGISSAGDPSGCIFADGEFRFNRHTLGQRRPHVATFCKTCQIVHDSSDFADWSAWSSDEDLRISKHYQRIAKGGCADKGLHPILRKIGCAKAAVALGLPHAEVRETSLAERPEGCYSFRNNKDGTDTLWVNSNPYSRGNGAETGNLDQGLLRQPICSRTMSSLPDRHSDRLPAVRFRKIRSGACGDHGGKPIVIRALCEAAANDLGLADTSAKVHRDAERPEGCYYLRSALDLTTSLWLNLDHRARKRGAETSDSVDGRSLQPICLMDMTDTVFATASFRMLASGHCSDDDGWEPIHQQEECERAAQDLGLVHTGALANPNSIVVNEGMEGSPEGCYFYANTGKRTASLILNANPASRGNGAEFMSSQAFLRQPLCRLGMRTPWPATSSTSTTTTSTNRLGMRTPRPTTTSTSTTTSSMNREQATLFRAMAAAEEAERKVLR